VNPLRNRALVAAAPLLLALVGQAAHADDDAVADVSPVVVTAPKDDTYRADRSSTATRTDTALRDIPQSITVITDELIRDQSMRGMADVVRYVPGVTMGQGEGHRDAPTLRGQSTTADFFVDGVRDDVQYFRDLYNVERVEVLKGPNAMIFGRGGGGGVINRVIKKPDWSTDRWLSAEAGSYEHRRAMLDANQPFSADLAGRLVGMYERSESFRDFVNVERWGVNPTLAWRGMDAVAVQLSYEHFEDDRTVDRGVPSFQGRPVRTRRGEFFGDPERSYSELNLDLVNLAVEYRVSDALLIRNRTVYGDYDKFYANIFPGGPAVAATGAPGVPATYQVEAYRNLTLRENLFNQTDLVWQGDVGGVRHTLLAGAELGRQETRNLRITGRFGAPNGPVRITVPFSQPLQRGLPIVFSTRGSDADNRVETTVAAAYLQDQIEIGERLQIIAGLRFDSFDVDVRDLRNDPTLNLTRRDFSRRDELWSPRLGVVFKPVPAASIYASYSISHLPSSGDQFASLTASTETVKPEEFENLEAGVKWEVTPGLFLSAAVYRLERSKTTLPDPARPGQVLQTGEARTKGFEAEISGRLTEQWEIIGGYSWQDAEITSATSAAPAGRKIPLAPEHTFSLWNKYSFTPAFAAGVGVIHQEDMFASITNQVVLPSFTRVDAALFVTLSDRWRAQVNVENLFNERYFPTSHNDNNILPGAPRSVRVGVTAAF
jgi:catecholate siderophore receptor